MTSINTYANRSNQGAAGVRTVQTDAGGNAQAGYMVTPDGVAAGRHIQTAGGAEYSAGIAASSQGALTGRKLTTNTGYADSYSAVDRQAGAIDRQQSFDNVAGHGYSGNRAVHVEDGTLHLTSQVTNSEGEQIRAKDLQVSLPRRC